MTLCQVSGTLGPILATAPPGVPLETSVCVGCVQGAHPPSESHLLAFFPSLLGVSEACSGSPDSGSPGRPNRVHLSQGEAPGWLPLLLPRVAFALQMTKEVRTPTAGPPGCSVT